MDGKHWRDMQLCEWCQGGNDSIDTPGNQLVSRFRTALTQDAGRHC